MGKVRSSGREDQNWIISIAHTFQGHHYYQQGIPLPMMAELSSEKRTPRKLESPSPRLSRVFPPSSPGPKRPTPLRRLRKGVSDASAHRSVSGVPTSGKENQQPGQLPSTQGKAIAQETYNWRFSNRNPVARQPSTASGGSEAQSNDSRNSRKRKLEYHLPRVPNSPGIDDRFDSPATATQPADLHNRRPELSRSSTGRSSTTSRAASVASGGPRKLSRISSVAKQYDNLSGTMYIVDSRSETGDVKRRRPPKLRAGSAKALNGGWR